MHSDGNGDHEWVDRNHNGIPDLSDPDEFDQVALGQRQLPQDDHRGGLGHDQLDLGTARWWILMAILATAFATSATSTGCGCFPMGT